MQWHSSGARYRGPIQAVLFDWAGTVIDFGSRAPTATFVRVFGEQGVTITEFEARGPMGTRWGSSDFAALRGRWQRT